MSESLFDKLNDDNWKDLAGDIARLVYPVGALVEYYDYMRKQFGVVYSISKLGRITIKCGTLPVAEVTDNGPGQGTFWYDPDINKFKIEPAHCGSGPNSMRFTPTYYCPDWKEKKLESPIKWMRENSGLYKVEIEDNGLTKDVLYFG